MYEDGMQNAQPTPLEQPHETPRWYDQAEGEGPIETPAADVTPDTRVPVSPPPEK
jgi:hypothetical protein